MLEDAGSLSVIDGPLVVVVYIAAGLLALALFVPRPGPRWSRRSWRITSIAALVGGAVLGLTACLVFIDAMNLFDVGLSIVARAWVSIGFAGVALAAVTLVRSRWWRKIVAVLSMLVFLATSAMTINIDIGTYTTVDALLGVSPFETDTLPTLSPSSSFTAPLSASWSPPADMPTKGSVGSVTIPATVSKFVARDAVVYLPPAALTAHPPALPVVITLSGQPGTPSDPLVAGHLTETLDAYAAAHNGLAPIVVSPDQLGAPENNPMCVDGAAGNSATYLTVDVVNWISAHLPVSDSTSDWAIAGFSQGGTCAIQLGGDHPELFGALLDISGEVVPANGDEAATIESGFGGSRAAYIAAQPLTILKKHTPYDSTFAIFAVGQTDDLYGPFMTTVSTAAQAAGMTVSTFVAPASGHDYTTATYAFARGFAELSAHWGLGS